MAAVLGNSPVAKGSLLIPGTAARAFPDPRLCVGPVGVSCLLHLFIRSVLLCDKTLAK